MNIAGKVLVAACGLVLGLAAARAHATVVYQWHPVASSGDLIPVSGTLEVTDAAWAAGSLDYHFAQNISSDHDAASPVIAVEFRVDGSATEWGGPLDVNIYPVTGLTDGPGPWSLDAALGFGAGGLLTGSLTANDQQSDYYMTSNASGSLWTINGFNTDASLGECFFTGSCSGATGFWQLESGVNVPEPASLGLFALGVTGLLLALRYARKRRQPRAPARRV